MAGHQSPTWRRDLTNDIFIQERRLHSKLNVIGYAAGAIRFMTTYEYVAPRRINHGMDTLHDEISPHLILEDLSDLLGNFVALYEAVTNNCVQIHNLESQVALLQGEAGVYDSLHQTHVDTVRRDLCIV